MQKSLLGIGGIIGLNSLSGCDKDTTNPNNPNCPTMPTEIAGPFPIKSPSDWVRANIIGNRSGVALMINFTILNVNDNCNPLANVFVDLWQCDAKGNYSEYAQQLDGDFTSDHFLRGRQTTDASGKVSFISIYPGWYPGRAPHLHVEVKNANGNSLLVTQIAFPENISTTVYANQAYNGVFDTSNTSDGEFADSVDQNMVDSITGDVQNGYTAQKTIRVEG